MARIPSPSHGMSLFTATGRRKYLTPSERLRFMSVAAGEPPEIETLCLALAWTGCRISETLALVHADIDHDERTVSVRCLKKRRPGIVREVPVPTVFLTALVRVHGDGPPDARLWTMARSTAWRHVKNVMQAAGVGATAASPKGLRHGFGVHALRSGIPLNLLQRWLGHADIATTAIYADVMGAEEREIASRMW
ncbi:tyrosine-type recombinase/integrase [Methylobacterium sp. J-092]|uniref:tyrosine-type recombinase/integrase n=1 Tax=Methylobacterium sp. J-092 TaxID=2836667 RepID=UPI001FBC0BB5|nr:site-specific integrase [Methylobacterium sp. J-092]MCJ2006258.1 site-specific integrase [Methylobacterium sp. J-092]